MGYNQFILKKEELDKLPFLGKYYKYLYVDSMGKSKIGCLISVQYENFIKLYERLRGKTDKDKSPGIVAGDKVYILPNSSIPMFKIKEHIKNIGAKIVTDIVLATKVLGHDRILSSGKINHNHTALLRTYNNGFLLEHKISEMSHIKDYYTSREFDKSGKTLLEYFQDIIYPAENVCEFSDIETIGTIVDQTAENKAKLRTYSVGSTMHVITPTCAHIMYYVLLKKIPVINEDTEFNKMSKSIVIDRESYNTINEMLNSHDDQSKLTGAELMANCDINASLYWLYILVKDHKYKIDSLSKFKNIRSFIEKSDWGYLKSKSSQVILEKHKENNSLTEEMVLHALDQAYEKMKSLDVDKFFKVTLQANDEYADIVGEWTKSYNLTPESIEEEVEEEEEEEETTEEEIEVPETLPLDSGDEDDDDEF